MTLVETGCKECITDACHGGAVMLHDAVLPAESGSAPEKLSEAGWHRTGSMLSYLMVLPQLLT